MSEIRADYIVKTPGANEARLTKKEWQLILRIRQARNHGHKMILVELPPSDIKWSLVGKPEG